ncbi:hypothetical protein GIB67_016246, partial [Kingdonia uniflora]
VNIPIESAEGLNIPQGSKFETESAQAGLGAQPPLPNVCPDFDENIPTFGGILKGTDVSARYLVLFAKDKVAKKWSWGSAVLAYMYYNLGAASRDDGGQFAYCTTLLESWIFAHFPKLGGIPKEMDSDAYEHYPCWKWDVFVTDRYGGTTFLNFREALDNYKLEDTTICPITVDLAVDDSGIHQRLPASVNERGDIPVHQYEDIAEQYDASILEYKNLEEKNISLEAELRYKSGLEDCNQSLFVELNKNIMSLMQREIESLKAFNALLIEQIDLQLPPATPPVPDTTLGKKYEDLLAAHDDIKKKLIAKEDFEVWRQALKKALASEGMGDMGDPTFEELFEQNERFFTIAQQGPKGDYQEDLVSTAVTLENVVIARGEKMTKKKKMQELLFQPWTKYLVDVRGVEISDYNSSFRVTAAIQHPSQHKFPDVMKSLKTFLGKVPAFWKSIFS